MFDNRNLIMAIVFSVVILIGFQYYSAKVHPPPEPGQQASPSETPTAPTGGVPTAPPTGQAAPTPSTPATPATRAEGGETVSAIPQAPGSGTSRSAARAASREQALAQTPRVEIRTPRLTGSIALIGARIDDLVLIDYREELDTESPPIVLLKPRAAEAAYYAQFGWTPVTGVALPGATTEWAANRRTLAPGSPVTLTWDNGAGLRFVRTYALDDNYMFTITQRVESNSTAPVTLYPYGLVARHETPDITGFFILHEGLVGVFDGTLKEVDYEDLSEAGQIQMASTGGWIGITDKFWLTALIPDQAASVQARFVHQTIDGVDKYQADYVGTGRALAPGARTEVVSHFFAGAKEISLLDGYSRSAGAEESWIDIASAYMLRGSANGGNAIEGLGIANFDLAIDFGWFYFLTKPIFYLLIYLNSQVGNFGLAILLLTVVIKLAFFPLANKSYTSMSKMKKLQPEMLKLRERFGDDRARMNQEMMALYKREKANPASGCLPMFVQIPVFFALYKVLFVTIEMRHAPFYGWIHDLSAPDPTSIFNLFGLIPWDPATLLPDAVNIGVWPLIMGLTMWLQQRLNPQPADPIQAKIFMFLPIMFTFLLARFPAGLVVYWAWNNLLSIIQQKVIMMRMGVK